jgi:ADP-ribosyl-[dinitrogen reductase] hydrolase
MSSSSLPASILATKIRTSLLGLALGDALGGPVEFHPRGTFPFVTTLLPNTNFGLPPGAWTDDTSMALCLADSLTSQPTFSESDQASRYVRWVQSGYLSVTGYCFDVGNGTRAAVGIWASGAGLQEVKRALDHKVRCGNGSLMRVLPVALAYWRTPEKALEYARRSSTTTHPHVLCQEACAVYVHLVTMILSAADSGAALEKMDLLQALGGWNYENAELRDIFTDEKWVRKGSAEIRSSGYVVHTLEAALWAFFGTESFEEGAIKVVNLGDDADTVGAVYGGIAGAWYGGDESFWTGKTNAWREGLLKREIVEGFAEKLVGIAG